MNISIFYCKLILVLVWLVVIESGFFPHTKRGFFCDDRSISMRSTGDTISTLSVLLTILWVYPILWCCEACYFTPVSLKSSRFMESARMAWKWYKEFVFGMALKLFVVDGIKVCICFVWISCHYCFHSQSLTITCFFSSRFCLVNYDHTFWILVVQMLIKLVALGNYYKFV